MTPQQFINKWAGSQLTERQACQQHFLDLCELVNHPKPAEVDKTGTTFCFERGATKTGGGHGWADVWKRGYFAFEYKRPKGSLEKALQQVQHYALALENPPLLIVCDTNVIQIHTNFTNTPSVTHTIALQDIGIAENLVKLRAVFFDPDRLKPTQNIDELTAAAAEKVAAIAADLQAKGHDPHKVAHFLNQCIFCCFAEDAGLLPLRLFTRLLESGRTKPASFLKLVGTLFDAMRNGGYFGSDEIDWFNGGLFAEVEPIELSQPLIDALLEASRLDWSHINPSILGTLFERGLDPAKRGQLGAHYTDAESILRILRPVIEAPLWAEWKRASAEIEPLMALWHKGGKGSKKAKATSEALYHGFLEQVREYKVLDPACGSGNFLYLSLRMLKDIQHRAMLEAETLGLQYDMASLVGPEAVLGIELSPYAAELARVAIWIGEIQWMLDHGFQPSRNPLLKNLKHIDCRDALLTFQPGPDGPVATEAHWPDCDVVVGNPPFIGDKLMRERLGDDYTETLRRIYDGRVPGGADLVCYWFAKAHESIRKGAASRAGLVSTNSIRQGANRRVLDAIVREGRIYDAWEDEPWINEGASVRVSLTCFEALPANSHAPMLAAHLNGQAVARISANLRPAGSLDVNASSTEPADLTQARRLAENEGSAFIGTQKSGPFDVSIAQAVEWLGQSNPNGKGNDEVLAPWSNGLNILRRAPAKWIIDFGCTMDEPEAMHFEGPYEYARENVLPKRAGVKRKGHRTFWWRHGESRPGMRAAITNLPRYIAIPRVAKHFVAVWLDRLILPDCQLVVVARADDTTFGVVSSRFHRIWSLALCSALEDRPRYTPSTTWATYPFPEFIGPSATTANATECLSDGSVIPAGLSGAAKDHAVAIATAAQELSRLRENWLNPPDKVEQVLEWPGYPRRPRARQGFEATVKKLTLTKLYNAAPTWLRAAHEAIDTAVAAAYGWTDYSSGMPDEEILRRLLALNLSRRAVTGPLLDEDDDESDEDSGG
ncbi:class I SAM-dependent DNA methyltransferase [Ralstonia pseudosolanacearum]